MANQTNKQPGLGQETRDTPTERPAPLPSKLPDRGPAIVKAPAKDSNWSRK